MLEFGHVITAMITPFTQEGAVDFDEARRLGHWLIQHGTDTLLISGTTGESPTLTHDEEFRLWETMISEFKGKAKIMIGTGSNSTTTAIESTKKAELLGADAVLQVVPYYNKPSQEGMFRHFQAVATSTNLPVLLYNIPGRTGVNMTPETMLRLSHIPNIIGVKEAGGSVDQVKAIHALLPDSFLIYSGDDGLTLPFLKEGAVGVVSVASHLVGSDMQDMISAFNQGDIDKATHIDEQLRPLFDVLFITSNPSPLKAALNMTGFHVGDPRLPLVATTDDENHRIQSVLKSLKLIK